MNTFVKLGLVLCLVSTTLFVSSQVKVGADNDVRPINNKLTIDGSQLIYALPKNVVRVKIDLKQTENFQGPYAKYAKEFLNISEGVIYEDDLMYEIVDVNFSRLSSADSNQFYSISYSSFVDFPEIQLNEDGVILSCNLDKEIPGYDLLHCQSAKPAMETTDYLFSDLGIKPFQSEVVETLYRMVPTDSTPVKEAYKKTSYKANTDEQNAEAAAAFIRKLRKRKFKLITSQFEEVNAVHGEAMNAMIESLSELEQSYLELFVGKTFEKKQSYYFDYIPSSTVSAEQKILCWFSPKDGIQAGKPDARKSNYEPILLNSVAVGSIPEPKIKLMDNSQKTPTAIKYGLYYRIPGRVEITLQQIDQVLAKQQMQIAQKGKVVPLPVDYLNDADYGIEFYPETGALKRVTKRKSSN